VLINGYFDGSGGSEPTKVLSVAGYLLDSEMAKQLNREWGSNLDHLLKGRPESKRYFRMTEFMRHRTPPWSSMMESERADLRITLAESAKKAVLAGILVAVKIDDFARAQPQVRKILSNPYVACAKRVMDIAAQYVKATHGDAKITYFFEKGDAGQKDLDAFLDRVHDSDVARARYSYKNHLPLTKTAGHPLWAADMLAWEFRTAIEDDILEGRMEDAPREYFNMALETDKPMLMQYLHPTNLSLHATIHKSIEYEL